MNWKYTDTTNAMVFRVRDDGGMESCLSSVLSTEDLAAVLPPDPVDYRTPILDQVRAARDDVLNKLMGIAFAAQVAGDAATAQACLTARSSLLNITTAPAVAAATDDTSLKAALVAAYDAIVLAAGPGLVKAFSPLASGGVDRTP